MSRAEEFTTLMKNDIFGLDKELDFGIYHIFKRSKKSIDKLLNDIAKDADEEIYDYLYNFFSLYYEGGDFGYTKRAFATFTIPSHKQEAEKCVFDSSHSFFYDGEETKFFWKTQESYYIKSAKYFDKLTANIDDYAIVFQVVGKDYGFDSQKTRLFRLVRVKKEKNRIVLDFNVSNHQTPKHAIYLIVKNMIDRGIDEIEYTKSDDFEKIPPNNSLFHDFEIDGYKKYLFDKSSIFKNKKASEENKTQIFSHSKLYITKKEYALRVYKKNEAKEKLNKKRFDFEDKKDVEELFDKDDLLRFFYRLDRAFNDFLTGVDSDYFIHKNLKRFLLTELDKFIKNYILYDTDLLLSEKGERLRKKALLFKEKAKKLIEFLSAVEEFQKYLWEKRKLIKRVDYIVTTNKIDNDDLLNRVLGNERQTQEWIEMGLCNETPSIQEMKERPYPVDTKYFDEEFKIELLSRFENFEEEIDGILIKSENFQALKFLEPKFKERVKMIYIDPPYNTGNDGFVYKDDYKESSWLSMMNDRLSLAKKLMKDDGVIFTQIDEGEAANLKQLKNIVFGVENFAATIHVQMSSVQGQKVGAAKEGNIVKNAEYILTYSKNGKKNIAKNLLYDPTDYDTHYNKYLIPKGEGKYIEKNLTDIILQDEELKKHLVAIGIVKNNKITNDAIARAYKFSDNFREWIHDNKDQIASDDKTTGLTLPDKVQNSVEKGVIVEYKNNNKTYLLTKNSNGTIRQRILLADKIRQCHDFERTYGVSTIRGDWWAGFYKDMGNVSKEDKVKFPNGKKASRLIEQLIYMVTLNRDEWVLDFFAGSGTTAAVAYKMNRKFILVEMNDYFETTTLQRTKYAMLDSGKRSGLIQYFYLQQYDENVENLNVETKNIDAKPELIFNLLKNAVNEVEIKPNLETLMNFVYHRGLKLKSIKKENGFLIGECEEGIVLLGNEEENFNELLEKFDSKIYTNLVPVNGVNPNKNRIEIIAKADFGGA